MLASQVCWKSFEITMCLRSTSSVSCFFGARFLSLAPESGPLCDFALASKSPPRMIVCSAVFGRHAFKYSRVCFESPSERVVGLLLSVCWSGCLEQSVLQCLRAITKTQPSWSFEHMRRPTLLCSQHAESNRIRLEIEHPTLRLPSKNTHF
jgi:hypothetical protein